MAYNKRTWILLFPCVFTSTYFSSLLNEEIIFFHLPIINH